MTALEAGTSRPSTPRTRPATGFAALGLPRPILRALDDEGYDEPTPIQAQAIPPALEGRDVLGIAKTGTGKTAAFLLPLLARLGPRPGRDVRLLIVSPTRELAAQIGSRAEAYARYISRFRHTVIYGGVNQRRQERALRDGPSIVVATPGRLLDLVQQGVLHLDTVDMLVLDEADRMFDMGFLPDVKRIVREVSEDRQTLLFSATMPPDIERLAQRLLVDPVRVSVRAKEETSTATIDQAVYFVPKAEKRDLLLGVLASAPEPRALVFTRTKRGANRLAEQLGKRGVSAAAIHGNKSQNARDRALAAFRSGQAPVLVATDVAARGIDVKGVSHVINYELPDTPENYVHRIGRTGRAGASGQAISLCDPSEHGQLRDIERHLKRQLPVAGGARPAELRSDERRPSGTTRGRPGSAPPRRRRRRRPGGGGREGRAAKKGGGEGGREEQGETGRQRT
ncbi:MAG: DEAD/DEAH box helicase, partial [Sandaracinaceae bacterium]